MSYLLIIIVWLLVFSKTWKFGLVIDDINRAKTENTASILDITKGSFVGSLNKEDIYLEHFFSTIIHLLSALLICKYFTVYSALLFLLHPNCLQVACWLNGKRYGIGTIIALIALFCPSLSGIGIFSGYWQASTLLFGLYSAIVNIKTGYIFTALILIYFLVTKKHLIIFGRYKSRENQIAENCEVGKERFILAIKLYGKYFLNTIFPQEPAMFYPEIGQFDLSIVDREKALKIDSLFNIGCISLILTFVGIFYFPLMIIFPISVIPYCHIFKKHVVQSYSDRYAYCAQIGIFAVLGLHWYSLILAGFYLAKTLNGLMQYENMEKFVEYNYKLYPNCMRASYFYALKKWEKQNLDEAYLCLKEGLKYNPHGYDLLFLMARINNDIGRKEIAIRFLKEAKKYTYFGQEEKQIKTCDRILEEINV